MVDQPFLTWAHTVVASAANRTETERATDVFNVRDYHQSGDSDSTLMIQRAIDAAAVHGGTVFLPPGNYSISSTLYVGVPAAGGGGSPPAGSQSIRIIGCGPSGNYDRGTTITGNFRGYLLYSSLLGNAGNGVCEIQGITFDNQYTSATLMTQLEPASSPDGAGAWNGNGTGCVYLGGGIGNICRNCIFLFSIGCGYFNGGFQGSLENCGFQAAYDTGHSHLESVGIMCRSLNIRNCKIGSCGIGIAAFKGSSVIEFMNVERCGYGFYLGANPYTYWDSNDGLTTAGNAPIAKPGIFINSVAMDSHGGVGGTGIGGAYFYCINCAGEIRNVDMGSYGQDLGSGPMIPSYGLDASGANHMLFYNLSASGIFDVAGINVGGGANGGCQYIYCHGSQTGGSGTGWVFPGSQLGSVIKFDQCLTGSGGNVLNGAFPLSIMPSSAWLSDEILCSDSTLPALGNIGAAIVGSGINRVLARFSVIASSTCNASYIATATSIVMTAPVAAAVQAAITAGATVWFVNLSQATRAPNGLNYSNTVANISSATVTLNAGGANIASSGSSDKIAFATWCIAG